MSFTSVIVYTIYYITIGVILYLSLNNYKEVVASYIYHRKYLKMSVIRSRIYILYSMTLRVLMCTVLHLIIKLIIESCGFEGFRWYLPTLIVIVILIFKMVVALICTLKYDIYSNKVGILEARAYSKERSLPKELLYPFDLRWYSIEPIPIKLTKLPYMEIKEESASFEIINYVTEQIPKVSHSLFLLCKTFSRRLYKAFKFTYTVNENGSILENSVYYYKQGRKIYVLYFPAKSVKETWDLLNCIDFHIKKTTKKHVEEIDILSPKPLRYKLPTGK